MVKAWVSGTIVSAADTQRWEDGVADALNAASRTKHAPSIGEFYPEAEGAVGDGSTNTQPAFTNAITAAAGKGAVDLIDGGSYALASLLSVPAGTYIRAKGGAALTSAVIGTTANIGGAGANAVATPSGLLTTGSTAGSFTLSFAQATADASDAILRAGSWVMLTRIA